MGRDARGWTMIATFLLQRLLICPNEVAVPYEEIMLGLLGLAEIPMQTIGGVNTLPCMVCVWLICTAVKLSKRLFDPGASSSVNKEGFD